MDINQISNIKNNYDIGTKAVNKNTSVSFKQKNDTYEIEKKEPERKDKELIKKERIEKVKADFLHRINGGENKLSALFKSFSAIKKGNLNDNFQFYKVGAMNITPENCKKWLKIIGMIVPILSDIVDLIEKIQG